MAVTADELELPLFVTEDLQEMADKFNITKNNLKSSISHQREGSIRGYKFIRLYVDD